MGKLCIYIRINFLKLLLLFFHIFCFLFCIFFFLFFKFFFNFLNIFKFETKLIKVQLLLHNSSFNSRTIALWLFHTLLQWVKHTWEKLQCYINKCPKWRLAASACLSSYEALEIQKTFNSPTSREKDEREDE